MRKYLVLLATAAATVALVLVFSGSAAAKPGDHGNACPPASPAGGGDPPCGHGNGGGGGPPPQPPEGNCESADLILLTEDAKIICLYAPPNGNLASTEEECPDALIATGPDPILGGGICIFLPPADS